MLRGGEWFNDRCVRQKAPPGPWNGTSGARSERQLGLAFLSTPKTPGLGLLGAIHMFGSTSFYCSPAIAFWPFAPAAPFPAILASPLPLRRWLNAPVPGPCRGGRGSRAPPCKSEWGVRGAFSALVNKEESCPSAALKAWSLPPLLFWPLPRGLRMLQSRPALCYHQVGAFSCNADFGARRVRGSA